LSSRIPKTLHYCFGLTPDFGGKPWSLVHYVGVSSAIRHIKPDAVYIYYEFEPRGPWWDLIKPLAIPVKVQAPTEIFGRSLSHPAHRADVVRLERLIETGGIYLDADVIVHRSFDELLDNSVVMGLEGFGSIGGMANAVILAEPNAPFLRRWYESYRTFRGDGRGKYWNEHSVLLPAQLARKYPDEVTVLPPTAFFWPLWSDPHLEWLFASVEPIPVTDAFANHLWESNAWMYLDHLTPGQVRNKDSNFHRWARPYVAALPEHLGRAPVGKRAVDAVRFCKRKLSSLLRFRRRGTQGATAAEVPTGLGRRETFEDIYENSRWGTETGSPEFFSGVGSRGAAAEDYVDNITARLRDHEDNLGRPIVVVDIGCGDFAVGRALVERLPTLSYIGCDIVRTLIERHIANDASNRAAFYCLDVVTERPPKGDVCLVRQVFQHLSNAEILGALKNLEDFEFVYITEGQPEYRVGQANPDKRTGADVRFDWRKGVGRGVELSRPPFSMTTEEAFRTFAFPHEVIVTERIFMSELS
jgi:hypothetical protein